MNPSYIGCIRYCNFRCHEIGLMVSTNFLIFDKGLDLGPSRTFYRNIRTPDHKNSNFMVAD